MGALDALLDSVKNKNETKMGKELIIDEKIDLGQPVYLIDTYGKYFYPKKCELLQKSRHIKHHDDSFSYANLYKKGKQFFIVQADYGVDKGKLFKSSIGKEISAATAAGYGFEINNFLDQLDEIDYT